MKAHTTSTQPPSPLRGRGSLPWATQASPPIPTPLPPLRGRGSGHLLSFAIEETVRPVAIAQVGTTGAVLAAYRHGMWTVWMETAPTRRIDQTRGLSSYAGDCLTHIHLRLYASSYING